MSRRRALRRVAGAAGAALGGVAVLGVADADCGDDARRPLFTERFGDAGPVLVFLPGLGLTTSAWRPVAVPLAGGARAVLVDLLGFGRSPKPWTTYSVARHVAELHWVLAPLAAGGPVTLVGHSIGARLALAYTAAYPAAVERLVLVSLPYFGGEERAKRHLRARGGWVWTHRIPFALACLLGRRLFGWALPLVLRDLPRDVVDGLKQMTWRSSTSTTWEVIYGHDLAADVARVPAHLPFVCLHGDRDETAPLDRMRALVALHTNCRIVVAAGADHLLPIRRPGWVRARITEEVGLTERHVSA